MESDSDSESDSVLIECNGIGNPVHIDPIEQKKFYLEYSTGDLRVKVGDCVRLRICEQKPAAATDLRRGKTVIESSPEFAYGQVMAVFEDSTEIMLIEVKNTLEIESFDRVSQFTTNFSDSLDVD